MNSKFKNMMFGGVVAAAAAFALTGQANAAATWQVDDNEAPAGTNVYNVDQLSFVYSSSINQIIAGGDGLGGNDDTFTEQGHAVGQAYSLNGSNSPSNLCGIPGTCYGLTADFIGHGETNVIGGDIAALFTDFSVDLYFDTDLDGVGDDLFATASLAAPSVVLLDNLLSADGNFSVLLDVTLLAGYEGYWIPSQMVMTLAGNVDDIALPAGLVAGADGSYDMSITNAVTNLKPSAAQIAEPATLGLLGFGLLGLGLFRRRRTA